MRHTRLKKKHTPINTSELPFAKPHKFRDREYLDDFKGKACQVCGRQDGTVVGAHVNYHNYGARSKNHDYYTAALCGPCHQSHDTWPAGIADWWMVHFILPMLKRAYGVWKDG